MEIRKGLTERLNFSEEKEEKRENLLAFRDFCLDFFGREDCICLPHAGLENSIRREEKRE